MKMVLYFFVLFFFCGGKMTEMQSVLAKSDAAVPKWEDTTPVNDLISQKQKTTQNSSDVPKWEDCTPVVHFSPSQKNWAALRKAFAGDPLAFIDDNLVRWDMRKVIGRSENPDQEEKKWALAAYFAQMNKKDILFCHANMESLIKQKFGKIIPVKKAYYSVAKEIFPHDNFFAQEYKNEIDFISCVLSVIVCLTFIFIFIKKYKSMKKYFLKKLRYGFMSQTEKILFWFSLLAVFILVISLLESFTEGFYLFLRWVVCASFIGNLINKQNIPICVLSLLGAILYNPIAPIHLGDRDLWQVFNLLTIAFLMFSQIVIIKRPRQGDK